MRRWGLGRCFGLKGGALTDRISAPIRDPTEISSPFCCVKAQREVNDPKDGPQCLTVPVLSSQTSSLRNREKWVPIVYKLPNPWYFVIAAWTFLFWVEAGEGDNMALHSTELTQGFSLCLAEWGSTQCHIRAQVLSHKAVGYVAFRTRCRHQPPKPSLSSALFSIHVKPV